MRISRYCSVFIIRENERHLEKKTVWLLVHDDNYCELWKAFGFSGKYKQTEHIGMTKSDYEVMREVYDWLSDCGLVELRPVGPEDSEWFVTDDFRGRVE